MKKITIDNTHYYENFRIYDKFMNYPEKLTRREKKRLRDLGIEVQHNLKQEMESENEQNRNGRN